MAAADGPTRLLEVCGQRLSRFLHNARHKHLAWLREVEEQGMRLLESSLGAEPELMPKTPSQRRLARRGAPRRGAPRQPCPREDSREPSRRRLSRRRSSSKPALPKPSSQRHLGEEQPASPRGEAAVPGCATRLPPTQQPQPPAPVVKAKGQGCPQGGSNSRVAHEAGTGQEVPGAHAAPELHNVSSIPVIPLAREEEEAVPARGASTSTPKAARNGGCAALQGEESPQGLQEVQVQDPENAGTPGRSRPRRGSGRRSLVGGPKSHRASLAEKYSLVSRREKLIRRSISRAMAKKAAAQESSSASSRVSCQSSLEVFVEDVTSSVRPGLEPNAPNEESPVPTSSRSIQAASPPAQHSAPPEPQAGDTEGAGVRLNKEKQEQPLCAKPQENPPRIWTRSYKQAMGALWNRPDRAQSPVDEKHKSSANQTPPSSSSASKVVRPLKNFLQAVQRNQLLGSPGPAGQGGGIRNFIRHNTPSRPDPKGDFVEKERQRLESLRKKQEAEEQRRKKVEEEKRRRQAEMKQKREERLRKALQARERVEQMEEEKKKRMEQKLLQNDEKARDEKASEERSKKKLSRKLGEGDARRQKVLKGEEDEFEQQEPLQKRREDEVKERGKRVLELRNLVEQKQLEHMRKQRQLGKEKSPRAQPESAASTGKNTKEKESPKELCQLPGQEKGAKQPEPIAVDSNPWLRAVQQEKDGLWEPQELGEEEKIRQAEALTAASGTWQSNTVKRSMSWSYLGPPEESRSPVLSENNYGMDLNSDDSTDDEDEPRKPVPDWADGSQLNQAILYQYYHPMNVDQIFGLIPSPKLEDIFGKNKPRYFNRTSSAVWHSPPESKAACASACNCNS